MAEAHPTAAIEKCVPTIPPRRIPPSMPRPKDAPSIPIPLARFSGVEESAMTACVSAAWAWKNPAVRRDAPSQSRP